MSLSLRRPPQLMSLRSFYYLPAYYLTLLLFGAGGLGLSLLSLLSGWLPATDRSERFFQRLIHRHMAVFHGWCEFWRLVHVRYHGFERMPSGGFVLAANHLALIDIGLGEPSLALDRLEEAARLHAADLVWLAVKPSYDVVRGEARFAHLLRTIGLD